MPVLSKRIVLDCFYLLIFYFEKFSTDVWRLPCAVNVNLNLSILVYLSLISLRGGVSCAKVSTFLPLRDTKNQFVLQVTIFKANI